MQPETALPSVALKRIPYDECPLCKSQKMVRFARANCTGHKLYTPVIPAEITWMRCGGCAHVFTDGYFGNDIQDVLFAKAHDNQLPGHNIEAGRAISARIVERVCGLAEHVSAGLVFAGSSWLDVGFGDGSLLTTAEEFGFKPVGLDLRKQAVDGLRGLGIEAHQSALSEFATNVPQGSFRVISMADVLEHVPYPGKVLAAASDLLEYGGILFISCPNAGSLAWRQLTDRGLNPYWAELEHFHNFTRVRLTDLLAEHGFRVVNFAVSERYRLGMELICVKDRRA